MQTKRCASCDIVKSIEDFGIRKLSKDGHNHYCKVCANKLAVMGYHTRKGRYSEEQAAAYRSFNYPSNLKRCLKCKIEKGLDDFNIDVSSKDGLFYYCRACKSALYTKLKQSEYTYMLVKAKSRNRKLKCVYGINEAIYNELLEKQGGVCAICHKPETAIYYRSGLVMMLSIDHDHQTGKVRGLLCTSCNHALGAFHDDIDFMRNAINYLSMNNV